MNTDKLDASDLNLIIKTFSYSKRERKTFRYLSDYMEKIKPSLGNITKDEGFRKRFMTIGLFLTYRICNHNGYNFSTNMDKQQLSNEHRERIDLYLKYGGEPFDSTQEYLKRIPELIESPGLNMAKYVIG